ncbi:RHS repeat-associated core domain-containing protein [Haloferula sargassicola]|uniref:RHS repeat-associated core domain-containing protein n=1 Tax=Haloferula sargassicola TaxID=490096 RepID=UPI0033659527
MKAQWGDQTYATYRVHDEQGRMTELRTYRSLAHGTEPTLSTTSFDTTTWSYHPQRGFLTAKRDAAAKGADYTYTAGGRLKTRTWARGVVTTYGYDAGLLVSTDYSDSTPDVTITYDTFGRQHTVTQTNQSTLTSTYDPSTFAVDTETIAYDLDHDGSADFTRTLDRQPTDAGRDTGWELKNGSTVENESTYGYHPTTGRFDQVDGGSMGTFDYTYVTGSLHLLDGIAGPVATTKNTWEPTRDVLQKKENKVGTTTVSFYEYVVNALGQREGQILDGTILGGSDGAFSYRYNANGEIAEMKRGADPAYPAIGGISHDWDYDYDAIGNRESYDLTTLSASSSVSYTPNALNQYEAIDSLSPVYDLDGNATSYPVPVAPTTNATMVWDAENRLVSLTVSGTTTTYLYDAQSRRIAKKTGSTSTLTVYDGWNPVADYQQSGTGAPALSRRYQWGLDLSGSLQGAGGVGGLLAVKIGSALHYPQYDGNGNVTEYLSSSGAASASFMYDAYGNTIRDTDTPGTFDIRFSTKRQDAESELYYYGYRYYDPVTGRWPSRDPIGERGGMNLYGFVGNNGVNWVDTLGASPYSGVHPTYNPDIWNDDPSSNNCYTYACDRKLPPGTPGSDQQPGTESGTRDKDLDCGSIKRKAKADGLTEAKGDPPCCPKGYHKVKLFTGDDVHVPEGGFELPDGSVIPETPGMGSDYHWYREDDNGQWSNKHGGLPVGPQLDEDEVVADAESWGYDTPCGTMCAPDF